VSLRGVLFTPDGELLVVRRTSDGGWELPGGRLGAHEDATEGVHREIEEETGLDARVRRPVHAVSWRNDADNGRFGVYYHCEVRRRTVSLSREHTEFDWVSPSEATDRLSDVQGEAVSRATEVDER
jgi:8-oxo-dGTP pyrophosphatase MutT (NUDIX family)